MARIPEEEIERLKREISLEGLAEARGVELVGSGHNLVGRCPFHDDRTPSLVIDREKGVWHCMGACQMGGSVIDWVMKDKGVGFREAVAHLRGASLVTAPRKDAAAVALAVTKAEPLTTAGVHESALVSKVVAHYHATLKASDEGRAYLRKRGLESEEAIERFQLGYANRTLGYRVPSGTKLGGELRGKLCEVGIYRASGHEHLSGSLVVPLFDKAGQAVQLYGRKVLDNLREGTPKHLYLPGPHRGVFNRAGLGESDEVILCESVIDALTFWVSGYRNVTTAYGVEGLTEEVCEALVEAGVQVVQVAFDRDEAGDRGAEKVSARLKALGMETKRVLFPKGMDANSFAVKVGPAAKSLGLALSQAEWMRGSEPHAHPSLVASASSVASVVSLSPSLASSAPPSMSAEAKAEAENLADVMTPETHGDEVHYRMGERVWRVKAVGKRSGDETRVHVRVSGAGEGLFIDTLELRAARQRAAFAKGAAAELGASEEEMGRDLVKLLLEVEKHAEAKTKEATARAETPTTKELTATEREEALSLLRDPKLLERVLVDLERTGTVGEETNKLVGYLAATSRKLEEPLAIVIQSSSAAGKSSLMDAVLALIPEEERVQYSAMTGQSLFYMGAQNLKHKVLAIVEEEGAERASYALKLLQSEGELTIASAGKDPVTGKLVTHEYRVEGPVMIFLTTTAIEVDEELMNRCIVLTVDEGRAQTKAIHEKQRKARTLEGVMARAEKQRVRRLHRNAQRLLESVVVVNPFAESLSFTHHATRTRRDHMKYLTLIESVTLLYQYQRERKRTAVGAEVLEYIEATQEDVEMATKLAHAALGRSLDELPAQTRRLLHEMEGLVAHRVKVEGVPRELVRFTRRELRERTDWGNTQLKVHMKRLEELEYLLMHRLRGPHVQYELVYDGAGKEGEPFVMGLGYDRSGSEADRSGPGRPLVGPRSVGGRGEQLSEVIEKKALNGTSKRIWSERIREGVNRGIAS